MSLYSCSNPALRGLAQVENSPNLDHQTVQTGEPFVCDVAKSKSYNKSSLKVCEIPGVNPNDPKKEIYVLKLQGDSFQEIAHDQGYLLAEQIEDGSLQEALSNLEAATKSLSPTAKFVFEGLNKCIIKKIKKSVTNEFKEGIHGLYSGYEKYKNKEKQPLKFSVEQLEKANYIIELGNIAAGVLYEVKENKIKAAVKLFLQCGVVLTSSVFEELFSKIVDKGILKDKFACTGLVSPANRNVEGVGLIHARNLEQTSMINSWNKSPVVYIVNEGSKYKSYVAFGTAGLIFPGGISGFNEEGLSVSLHQMNTAEYVFSHDADSATIMPFLQQRILREAKNIDEAKAIIAKAKVYSSWTILVSDAKTNEVASFEIGAKKFAQARVWKDEPMGQSNHFIHNQMQKHHFHNRYSNYLETRGRLKYASDIFSKNENNINIDWTMIKLASHIDPYEDRHLIFGRSFARVSNIMSSIVAPSIKELWMTSGDRLPAIHGVYAGFRADFSALELTPIGTKYVISTEENLTGYYHYVEAYKEMQVSNYEKAYKHLKTISEKNPDPHVEYLKNRLLITLGNFVEADAGFSALKVSPQYQQLHPYTKGRIELYRSYAKLKSGLALDEQDKASLNNFKKVLIQLLDNKSPDAILYPMVDNYVHAKFDLKTKLKLVKGLLSGSKKLKIDKPDLSSVD